MDVTNVIALVSGLYLPLGDFCYYVHPMLFLPGSPCIVFHLGFLAFVLLVMRGIRLCAPIMLLPCFFLPVMFYITLPIVKLHMRFGFGRSFGSC